MTPSFPRDRHGRWTSGQRAEWEAIAAEMEAVELALLVAEAEREVILAEAVADVNVPDARRPLTPAEITSGVRFGPIDRRITETADHITAATDALAEHITRTVHDTTATAARIEDARRTVAGWASPIAATVMPGLAEHAQRAVDEIRPHLEQAWTDGAGDVLAEATHQGISPRVTPVLDAATLATISASATAVVTQRATRLLTVANTTLAAAAVPPVQAATQVQAALRATPVAGTTDAARQAVHQAQTSARTTTVRGMISAGHVPASFHSTEQLDSNTCLACSHVDGTEYATLDGVLADYREDGGCRWCAGGLRCRGFYVTVWSTETPATVTDPGRPVTPDPGSVTPEEPRVPGTPPPVPPGPPTVTPVPGDLPDPFRAIRLDQSTRVETVPRKPPVRDPDVETYDQAATRITDAPFLDREQPAVAWLDRRGITLRNVRAEGTTTSPDAVVPTERATVELKRMDAASRNSLRSLVRAAGVQSRNVVVDARGLGIDPAQARGWLDLTIRTDGHHLDQVVVILDGPGVPPLEWLRVQ